MSIKKVEEIRFSDLKELAINDGATSEGLVMLGCRGSLNEWINGISKEVHSTGVTTTSDPEILWGNIYKTITKDHRIDLIFLFNEHFYELFDVSKLAIWRIGWGDVSWVSDYLNNFASDHEDNEMTGGDLDVHIR